MKQLNDKCWGCEKELTPRTPKITSIKIGGEEKLGKTLCVECGNYLKKLLVKRFRQKQEKTKRCKTTRLTKYRSRIL